MQNSNILGIDLAKSVFQVHLNDRFGNKKFSKKIKRSALLDFIANQPKCLIAIEACGGAHYWARQFNALGHDVKIIHPQYVKPFVQVNKNDARDAHAIAEAAARPSMPTVAPKSVEQQDLQALHRIRERLVKEKTAISNELRGLLAEYGIVFSQGAKSLREGVQAALEDATNELSERGRRLISDLRDQWRVREQHVEYYDKELVQIAKTHPKCKQLQSIPGIGPVNATLLYAHAGDHTHFASARHFSASIGLVPKQHASGGKENLLGISKKGNKHVRKQLVHGARAAYRALLASEKESRLQQWVQRMEGQKHPNVIIVALANKLARIVWAVMKNDSMYQA
jgi:transposase